MIIHGRCVAMVISGCHGYEWRFCFSVVSDGSTWLSPRTDRAGVRPGPESSGDRHAIRIHPDVSFGTPFALITACYCGIQRICLTFELCGVGFWSITVVRFQKWIDSGIVWQRLTNRSHHAHWQTCHFVICMPYIGLDIRFFVVLYSSVQIKLYSQFLFFFSLHYLIFGKQTGKMVDEDMAGQR